jgi:rubrerythrin
MITGKENMLQALIEVFLMEKGTKVFYHEAAEKAVNKEVQKIFHGLSKWEEKHMDYVQYLYQSINDSQEIMSFAEFKNKADAPLTEAGIPVSNLEEKLGKYAFTDEIGALTLAMEIEGKAYNLYRKLSQREEDTNTKIVFKEMMDQKVRHIDYLKEQRVKRADVYN